jgi:histidinol-phosphatase
MSEFLSTALEAAKAAEQVIMGLYRRNLEVRLKEDKSPVTQADVEAEKAIRRIIEARYPQHGFHGEETGRNSTEAEYVWLVDPIDGTKAFVREYSMFSTQIALAHHGEIVVGVSNAPAYGELAWAERGEGAWLNGVRLHVSTVNSLEESALSSGNLKSLARSPRWKAYGKIVGRVNRIRGYGDFLHYHLLAQGKIDAVIESDVDILDIAALSVIVEEAGGRFTDLEGGAVTPDLRSVLATNSALHRPLLEALLKDPC